MAEYLDRAFKLFRNHVIGAKSVQGQDFRYKTRARNYIDIRIQASRFSNSAMIACVAASFPSTVTDT